MKTYIIMSNVFNRGGIINERKINIKGCCKQLLDTYAIEWAKNRNGDLTPRDVSAGSNKRVWWKCSEGHEWIASINDRNRGKGCPTCANKKIVKGYNDLKTVNPRLAKEWNFKRNGKLKPTHVSCNSNRKVWWKCSKGHEWQAQINDRNRGNNCPYCSKKKQNSK